MTTKNQTTPEAGGEDSNVYREWLQKRGLELEAPTGAAIVGVLGLADGPVPFDNNRPREWQAEHLVCAKNGSPVYVDEDDATWAVSDDGRWQPVHVGFLPPQVTFLDRGAGDHDEPNEAVR